MSADCGVIQILPKRDEECVRFTGDDKRCGSTSFCGFCGSCGSVNIVMQKCDLVFRALF